MIAFVCVGFVTMVAQALLLRRFLWHVAATDMGVGVFFAAWTFWVAAGAALARTRGGAWPVQRLASRRRLAAALYLPMFALQYALLGGLRALMGVPAYLTFPAGLLAAGSLMAAAPVSLTTGLLLPALVQRRETRDTSSPALTAARALAWEGLGAALGGIAITLALLMPMPLRLAGTRDWQRTFGAGQPDGSFTTPRGRYLYGRSGGGYYVLSNGGVTDHWPDPERAREIAAMLLAQHPRAEDVLMLGEPPIGVTLACREVAPRLRVWWCHSDPPYAAQLKRLAAASAAFGEADAPRVWPQTPQQLLSARDARGSTYRAQKDFDLVLLWPPVSLSAAGAAWWEPDWLRRVAATARPEGIVALPLGVGAADWSETSAGAAA
ncbi:MAG: hypothetical protein PHR35_20920, partial [Kiritimatiellae bacterium]|nr:hypothetical protein [Kiritimatiellia bacterium]